MYTGKCILKYHFMYLKSQMKQEKYSLSNLIKMLIESAINVHVTGNKLGGDLEEKVSLQAPTSPFFQLREKFKCI